MYAGGNHSIIWKGNQLYAFGLNIKGQLGLGLPITSFVKEPTLVMENSDIKAVFCGSHHVMVYLGDGKLLGFGHNSFGQLGIGTNKDVVEPELILEDRNIKTICCGGFSALLYKNNGDLLVCGCNSFGQLGRVTLKSCQDILKILMVDEEIKSISVWLPSYLNSRIQRSAIGVWKEC